VNALILNTNSNQKENFNCLQLNVQGLSSITESFKEYVKRETMEGDNMYDAGPVHGKHEAYKGVRFVHLPPVLQIQLKRFEFNSRSFNMVKINDRFEFDEVLDLDDLLEFDDSKDPGIRNIYHLHSIVMHRGSVNCGHYYAYIRNSTHKEQWL
jgi:ubiquitin carboxyl-terminal hydrolase 7